MIETFLQFVGMLAVLSAFIYILQWVSHVF